MTAITFPTDFIWGTATAAHQVEGNNTNSDMWLMEHVDGSIFEEPSLDACDHFHRYPSDIALLKELGFNTYRFSIEWARVEPEKGHFSRAALDHYRRMLQACHDNGLLAYVTFHHFSSPRWLIAAGGWQSNETPALFARYCKRVAEELGDLIDGACTINEANIGRVLTSSGMIPSLEVLGATPAWQNASRALGVSTEDFTPFMFAITDQGKDVVMGAHHQAVAAIRETGTTFPIGITLAVQHIDAVAGGEEIATRHAEEVNNIYLRDLKGDDFVGVQCYSRHRFGADGPMPPEQGVELTQMNYEFWPEALEVSIRQAHEVSGLPVLVTENGIATTDDTRRVEFVTRALACVGRCLDDKVPVLGYTYWSALDNFEWMFGYRPTFGLIAVDRTTQERTPKPSAVWLGDIARANRFDPETPS
jgi:beta-glucosidase